MAKTVCYKCGSMLPSGSLRCPNCGAPAPLPESEIAATSSRVYRAQNFPGSPAPAAPGVPPSPHPAPQPTPGPTAQPEPQTATEPAVQPSPQAATEPIRPSSPVRPEAAPGAPKYPGRPSRRDALHAPGAPAPKQPEPASSSKNVLIAAAIGAIALIFTLVLIANLRGPEAPAPRIYYSLAAAPLHAEASATSLTTGQIDGPSLTVADSPLEVIATNGEWVKVKTNSTEGYIQAYLLADADGINLLKNIFQHRSSNFAEVPEGLHRHALIDFFRSIPQEERGWELFGQYSWSRRTGNIWTGRAFNPESVYPDLAVLLNNGGSRHRLVYFTFTDQGEPRKLRDELVNNYAIDSAVADPSAPGGVQVTLR